MKIVDVKPDNAGEHSFFCIKNTKEPGSLAKQNWFEDQYNKGLRFKLLYADDGKKIGFIEYVPAEHAWRPVNADGYLFIHCIMVYPNKYRSSGAASTLIYACVEDAKNKGLNGVCTFTSMGTWMATNKLFEKADFKMVDKKGRFELMCLKLIHAAQDPIFINWEDQLPNYEGWHLLYTDQCPWHNKGVKALIESAREKGIDLSVRKIETSTEAKNSPTGFGVFAFVKDGKVLEDHYISKRRFETIIEKESIT